MNLVPHARRLALSNASAIYRLFTPSSQSILFNLDHGKKLLRGYGVQNAQISNGQMDSLTADGAARATTPSGRPQCRRAKRRAGIYT
jgi:hypothetical protein